MKDNIIFVFLAFIFGNLSSFIFSFISYKKGIKNEGEYTGEMRSDVQYIKKRSDDMLLEQKDTNRQMNAITERLVKCEESTKQAHKRIDELRGGHIETQ